MRTLRGGNKTRTHVTGHNVKRSKTGKGMGGDFNEAKLPEPKRILRAAGVCICCCNFHVTAALTWADFKRTGELIPFFSHLLWRVERGERFFTDFFRFYASIDQCNCMLRRTLLHWYCLAANETALADQRIPSTFGSWQTA